MPIVAHIPTQKVFCIVTVRFALNLDYLYDLKLESFVGKFSLVLKVRLKLLIATVNLIKML